MLDSTMSHGALHDKLSHLFGLPVDLTVWYLESGNSDSGPFDITDSYSKKLCTFHADQLELAKKEFLAIKSETEDSTPQFQLLSDFFHRNSFKGFAQLIAFLTACFPSKRRKSRRPLLLVDRTAQLPASFSHALSVRITHTDECACTVKTGAMRVCSLCGLARPAGEIIDCSECHAMLYCSAECLAADTLHHQQCSRIRTLYTHSKQLDSKPFTFNSVVSADDFDDEALTEFLKERGIYNLGMWVRETPHCVHCTSTAPYGDLDLSLDPFVLSMESIILETPSALPPEQTLRTWEDYYSWRGFDLHSPIAALMHYSLTVYHIIKLSGLAEQTGSLSVILAGADKEADLIPTFTELSSLLPNVQLTLTLAGPLISKSASSPSAPVFSGDTLSVFRHSGLVQDVCRDGDIVVCMNAGLSAYSTWKDAVLKLAELRLPCYITDFCLLSLESSRQALERLSSQETDAVGVELECPVTNPFRSPFRKFSPSTRLHQYSNGIISKLIYT